MKTIHPNSVIALMIVFLTLLAFAPASHAAAANPTLSKKELKALLKNARTPAEHRRVAEYYRHEAERLTAESKSHEEMGRTYANRPLPFEAKHPYGTLGLSHCRYWAKLDAEQADKAQRKAALHEEMAKKAESQPSAGQEPEHVTPPMALATLGN